MTQTLARLSLFTLFFGCESEKGGGAAPLPSAVTASAPAQAMQPSAMQASGSDPCTGMCAHAPALKCGSIESCRAVCEEMRGMPVCREQLSAFMRCAAQQPEGHWECDESKIPALRDGYCGSEQAAFMGCLQAAAAP